MPYPRLHALGALVLSTLYPILGILLRDAVAPIMLFGTLLLGVYRYFLGLGLLLRREMPDALSFLLAACRNGRKRKLAPLIAFFAAILFSVLMLLPARILLDVSVDWAKLSFFVPTLYCLGVALISLKAKQK